MADREARGANGTWPAPPEVRDAAEALRTDIANAFEAYTSMLARDTEADCWAWVELLAERWRVAMERYQLEQLGDEYLSDEAVQLYSAVEASFALSLSTHPERRALRLEVDELLGRMLAAGEGIWHEHWAELRESMLTELDRRAGRAVDLPSEAISRPTRRSLFQRKRGRQIDALNTLAGEAYVELARFYKELAPDGRELSERERQAAREQIEAAAAHEREVDLNRELFSERDWATTRMLLGELRSLRRSLALALSSDPARRALAVSIAEAGVRTFIFKVRADGASYEDAIEKLRALQEA